MVSLRHELSAIRRRLPLFGRLLCCLGTALLLLAVAGPIWSPARSGPSAARESLQQYVRTLRAGAPFDLAEATQRIYRGTTHSIDRRIGVTENWLHWTLGCLYRPLSRTQNAERLLAGQLTDCSERSQILKTLAEEAGYSCRFVGLSGHVVLEVKVSAAWQVADPDYGVVYPVPISELERESSTPLLEKTLAAAGYESAIIDRYRQIVQSGEDNVVLPVASPLSPRLDLIERCCDALAVLLPLGMVIGGGAMLRATTSLNRAAIVYSRSPGTPRA